jgi:DNA-directed RNA polymerase specialized sigma24 family protein
VTLVGLRGLTIAQAAKELGVSTPTAERDLRAARLWLAQRLAAR